MGRRLARLTDAQQAPFTAWWRNRASEQAPCMSFEDSLASGGHQLNISQCTCAPRWLDSTKCRNCDTPVMPIGQCYPPLSRRSLTM